MRTRAGLQQVLRAHVIFVTLSFVRVALGAPSDDDLIREGIRFRRAGDDASALKCFEGAYAQQKTPKALAQIGFAEQALGRWRAADQHLRQALEASDDIWIRKARTAIQMSLDVIDEHIGRLDVTGTPAGAEVRVDGESVGVLPFSRPIRVNAGGIALEVRAPGYVPIVRATTVRVRDLTRETFNLQLTSAAADPTSNMAASGSRTISSPLIASGPNLNPPDLQSGTRAPPADAPKSSRRILVFGAVGLAVAAIVFGVVEHIAWQEKASSFENLDGCGTNFTDFGGPTCRKLREDGLQARNLAFVGYGFGAALFIGATALFLTEPDQRSGHKTLVYTPTLLPHEVGCLFRF